MRETDYYKERLELALEAGGLDLWENDLVTGEVSCRVSKVLSELGYAHNEAAPYMDDMFDLVHPDDIPRVKEAINDHVAGLSEQYRCEFRIQAKTGHWVWYANYGRIMDRDASQPGRRFIGVTFNIDERKRREEELERINRQLTEQNQLLGRMNGMLQSLASSDSLTGIANRRKILEIGEHEVHRAKRFGHTMSLLIIDIDHFKQVNDTWGHPIGDKVICAIADTCQKTIRHQIDSVGRLGGEEFALILPEASAENAAELGERLRLGVEGLEIKATDGSIITTTISVGIIALTSSAQSFKDLLIQADRALYQAKDAGRNRVFTYQEDEPR